MILGWHFNRLLDNVDFKNITLLTLGYYQNDNPVDNVDIKNITHLTLDKNFNQSLNNVNITYIFYQ